MFQFDQDSSIGVIAAILATWIVLAFFGLVLWSVIRACVVHQTQKKHNQEVMKYFNSIEEFRRDFE